MTESQTDGDMGKDTLRQATMDRFQSFVVIGDIDFT